MACRQNGDSMATLDTPGLSKAGPDPVVVRVPLRGGLVRAFRFTALDSSIWQATHRAPPIRRLLGFDAENGVLAFADSGGTPGWVDLRMGTVRRTTKATYTALASADGWSIFGATPKNTIVRLTPTGDWQLAMKRPVKRLLPSPDGTLLVLMDEDDGTRIVRLRPPDDAVSDSALLPRAGDATLAPVGDRAYVGAGDQLVSLSPDALESREDFGTESQIVDIAPTPSGDRVFVANQGTTGLDLVDRYAGDLRQSVRLPGPVAELRMDPLGRYLLVRPESGDSAWIVSVSDEALVATVPTRWRDDLPTVALDGTVATVKDSNVVFVDPRTQAIGRTIGGGAADLWFFVRWNGFRPRARGIDEPVEFSYERNVTPPIDIDSATGLPRPKVDTILPPVTTPPPPPVAEPVVPRPRGWILSFAAVLSLERAREIATSISVDGSRPRVVTGETAGTTVYRVVLGPYDTREAAERVGRSSRHSYWIYEAVP